MTEAQRIEATEAALRAACVEARRLGLTLVKDADVVTGRIPEIGVTRPIGCCAMGALALTEAEDAEPLELEAYEHDAIEHGWDGERAIAERDGLPMPWFDLGARLAAEFAPVPASTLEAR
ncbi:hypothetical protein [Sorangium sp. So ce388]|uniref:hypothetical protein n=1 Tax=Sorangium sp. So ce388 TaxID=3133309 RepID=UPI003F5B6799